MSSALAICRLYFSVPQGVTVANRTCAVCCPVLSRDCVLTCPGQEGFLREDSPTPPSIFIIIHSLVYGLHHPPQPTSSIRDRVRGAPDSCHMRVYIGIFVELCEDEYSVRFKWSIYKRTLRIKSVNCYFNFQIIHCTATRKLGTEPQSSLIPLTNHKFFFGLWHLSSFKISVGIILTLSKDSNDI